MPNIIPENSVGIVEPIIYHFEQSLTLACGKTLDGFDLVYETYGHLNKDHSNAILICHALSGDHHAAGYHNESDKKPGWWDTMIGPNKPIDTHYFYVVSVNNLGGCRGSSGPSSINPNTHKPFGPDFPRITVQDWVLSQQLLMEHLSISKWQAVVGGSLGGMQALQWAIDFPNKLEHAILIASTSKLSAQNIAFNEIARHAITSDPDFHDGHYYQYNTIPKRGLMLARMLGHITYQSDEAMGNKFGRELYENKKTDNTEFQVERYLRYQGEAFVNRFDANTYLLMTRALDYFDPASQYNNNLSTAVSSVSCKFLIISFTSDWRFSPRHSWDIVKALLDSNKNVSYAEIDAPHGHDAFLLQNNNYINIMSRYLTKMREK